MYKFKDYDDLTIYLINKYVTKDFTGIDLIYKGHSKMEFDYIKKLILINTKINFNQYYKILELISNDINIIKSIKYIDDMLKNVKDSIDEQLEFFIHSYRIDTKEIEDITLNMLHTMFKNCKEMFDNQSKKQINISNKPNKNKLKKVA